VSRTKELKIAFNEAKHRQRVIQEDSGVISSVKVVTGSERRTKPTLMQRGNCEWVIVI
jgi:hypothetical protein